MDLIEILISMILFLLAAGSFTVSCFYFREKGFLLNNAYLFASKEERKRMDATPYYRQSAVIYAVISSVRMK